MSWLRKYRLETVLFLVALVVRLFLFGLAYQYEGGNLVNTIHGDDGYYEISRDLVDGHGFSGQMAPPYTPNPLRPPLYPFFLAFYLQISGSNYWLPFIMQLMLGSLIPVLGYMVLRRFEFSVGVSRFAALAVALDPYTALLSFIFYTETLFTVHFLIFLLFFVSFIEEPKNIRRALWTGVSLALAVLVKPTVQYVPLLVVVLFLFWNRKSLDRNILKSLASFLLIFCAALTPWWYRNYVEFGVVGMSAQQSYNLYTYLVPTVRALRNGTSFGVENLKVNNEPGFHQEDITLATDSIYARKAISILKDYPTELVKSLFITQITFFTHDGGLTVLNHLGKTPEVQLSAPATLLVRHPMTLIREVVKIMSPALFSILFLRLFWITVTFLFLGEVVTRLARLKNLSQAEFFAILLVFYFAATTSINGLGVNARFRVPVNILILGFAGVGAMRFFRYLKQFRA